jgi:hypothetical protein
MMVAGCERWSRHAIAPRDALIPFLRGAGLRLHNWILVCQDLNVIHQRILLF